VVLGSTAPGTSGKPGIGVFLHGGASVCSVEVLYQEARRSVQEGKKTVLLQVSKADG
jgi:hypothetical protein